MKIFAALTLVCLMSLGMATHAQAAGLQLKSKTFKVNSTLDETDMDPGNGKCRSTPSGVCTLRAAIMENNADGGGNTIRLPVGTFLLTRTGQFEDNAATGDLDVLKPVTIKGAGAAATIVDGVHGDRVFDLFKRAKIVGLTIQNGEVGDYGGGIRIEAGGKLKLRDSVVGNNQALYGGGIYGGADMTLNNSTVWNNLCGKQGSGIWIGYGAYIGQSRISNNCADQGGGIYATDLADVRNDWVLVDSTVDNNRAREGGGIYTSTGGYFLNSTITANVANLGSNGTGEAGGVYDASVIEDFGFYNVTVAANSAGVGSTAGGIYVAALENANLQSSILDNNQPDDCEGNFTSVSFNLIYNANGCTLTADPSTETGIHAGLVNLANNGGPTPTMALQIGSEALDLIPPAHCTWGIGAAALTADQRGQLRPADGDGNGKAKCDVGAFELQP